MTPILTYMIRNAAGLDDAWDANLNGIPSFRSFLATALDAAIYLIPEAETDTTAMTERNPERYATNAAVRMPWPTVWIEHRAYAPPDDDYIGDSALLLKTGEAWGEDHLLCYAVSLMGGRAFLAPILMFAWPMSELGNPDSGIGKPYRLRPSTLVNDPVKVAKACDFVRELLAFINEPSGVIHTTMQPDPATARLARAVLGPGTQVNPYTRLSAESEVVSASSVWERAARNMKRGFEARH
jgi:hypothetical protein